MTKIIIISEKEMKKTKLLVSKFLRKFRKENNGDYEIIIDCLDGYKMIKGRNKTDL